MTEKTRHSKPTGRRHRKKPSSYTQGEINKLIDAVVHPAFKIHPGFLLVDEALHLLVEQDLESSGKKFLKYTFPAMTREMIKQQSKHTKPKSKSKSKKSRR